ncbi:uncharacterized protein BDR25DRAFT_393282 [Lindgomyces ingoldianus]|uniref:Uncharacterized protein n=1 Tax=Lindgomyces ingoldianus TaxID=673940 RepID=A0ACB6QY43_9PLEO|nr:uncharacterized protein BDR25DRAFT_393282 [Lindgomyces ingoldianus]KAF2471737.1 hypothetical protein BDR25DRAFT_393282 [Lindgomyces ingoldianus]
MASARLRAVFFLELRCDSTSHLIYSNNFTTANAPYGRHSTPNPIPGGIIIAEGVSISRNTRLSRWPRMLRLTLNIVSVDAYMVGVYRRRGTRLSKTIAWSKAVKGDSDLLMRRSKGSHSGSGYSEANKSQRLSKCFARCPDSCRLALPVAYWGPAISVRIAAIESTEAKGNLSLLGFPSMTPFSFRSDTHGQHDLDFCHPDGALRNVKDSTFRLLTIEWSGSRHTVSPYALSGRPGRSRTVSAVHTSAAAAYGVYALRSVQLRRGSALHIALLPSPKSDYVAKFAAELKAAHTRRKGLAIQTTRSAGLASGSFFAEFDEPDDADTQHASAPLRNHTGTPLTIATDCCVPIERVLKRSAEHRIHSVLKLEQEVSCVEKVIRLAIRNISLSEDITGLALVDVNI